MTDSPPKGEPQQNPPESNLSASQQQAPTAQPQAQQIPPAVLARFIASAAARGALPYAPGPASGPGIPVMLPFAMPQAHQNVQLWQGQYPPPDAVQQYEKVLPGAFNRMVAMAEQLQAAQISETKRAQEFTQADARRGHWLGFAALVLGMLGAIACLAIGNPWVAAAFLSVPVMGVAKALIDSARAPSPSALLNAATSETSTENSPPAPAPPSPTVTGQK